MSYFWIVELLKKFSFCPFCTHLYLHEALLVNWILLWFGSQPAKIGGQFDLILSALTSFFNTLTCLGLLRHLGSRLNSWKF